MGDVINLFSDEYIYKEITMFASNANDFKPYDIPMIDGKFEWEQDDYIPVIYIMVGESYPDHVYKSIDEDKDMSDILYNISLEFTNLARELDQGNYPISIQMLIRERINLLISKSNSVHDDRLKLLSNKHNNIC